MKRAVAIVLIVGFALVTIIGILDHTHAGPTIGIPIASLIAAFCGLIFSVLSIRPIFRSAKMFTAAAAMAVVLIVSFMLPPDASVRSSQDARRDIARGRYFLLDYGFPFGVTPATERCLRQHGLEVRVVGLDIIDTSERSYYSSYISVMNEGVPLVVRG
jgi:hypothetical protein